MVGWLLAGLEGGYITIHFEGVNHYGIPSANEETKVPQKLHEICLKDAQEKLRVSSARWSSSLDGVFSTPDCIQAARGWYHLQQTRVRGR